MTEITPGWYHVDEMWGLYIDGELRKAHVSYVEVDDPADDDQYPVDHYDHAGEFLTRVTVTEGDLADVIDPSDGCDRPMHI